MILRAGGISLNNYYVLVEEGREQRDKMQQKSCWKRICLRSPVVNVKSMDHSIVQALDFFFCF